MLKPLALLNTVPKLAPPTSTTIIINVMKELLTTCFESQTDIKDHLQQQATCFVASKQFELMEPEERSNWLFRQFQLIKHFESLAY